MRVIRAFNNEAIEERKFNRVNRNISKLGIWVNRIISLMQPGMTLIISFTMLGIIWLGSHLVVDGNLEIGSMMAFMQYRPAGHYQLPDASDDHGHVATRPGLHQPR